jgi:nitronate monooxygenase
MNATKNTATKANYKMVWVAGSSIEHTNAILDTRDIVAKLVK